MERLLRHKRLVRWLFGINGVDITVSLLVNGFIALAPEKAESSNGGELNYWVYLNWLFLDLMQLSLCIFLMVPAAATPPGTLGLAYIFFLRFLCTCFFGLLLCSFFVYWFP